MKIYDATHRYENPNDETPHQRIDLLQQDVDVFPGVQNRSMSKIVNREAEFLGGSVFTVKDKSESVSVRACLYLIKIALIHTTRKSLKPPRTQVHYLTSSEFERDEWIRHIMRSIQTIRGTPPEKTRRKSSTMLVSAASGLWRDYKQKSEKPRHVIALEIVR